MAGLHMLYFPWKVIARGEPDLLSPQTIFENVGDVPNVVFPCAALYDPETGRVAVHYVCAYTVRGLAFAKINGLIDFVVSTSDLSRYNH